MSVSQRDGVGRPVLFFALFIALLVILLVNGRAPVVAGDAAPNVVVRMAPADWTAVTPALQPARLFDYDSFLWIELSPAAFAQLQASGAAYLLPDNPFQLTLGEQTFDPVQAVPDLPDGWASRNRGGPDFHLVQFAAPSRAEWLADLTGQGLEIVQYIYPNSYIVWGEEGALRSGADYVRWTGPFAPAYRVLPHWRSLPDERIDVHVLLYRGADVTAVTQQLEQIAGRVAGRAILNDTWEIVGLTMPGDRLQAAAHIPGVYSLQPVPTDGGNRGEMSNQINVNNHDANNLAYPGYAAWLTSVGLSGAGVIMANVDTGIQDNHPDLTNRMLPCAGLTCGGTASSSHGTHTAGIMAGDGATGVVDSFGFLRGQGVAPGANLVEQVYSPFYTQPGGMLLLMTESQRNGAILSGNSWGPSGTPRGYDNDTLQVDIGVRDADPVAAGNQPFSYILSIMNGNGGASSQGSPDEAKNIFTIGSTKMQNSNGSQILAINDLSSNSAHGPALDGRKIPHMVAPGCRVDSSVPTNSYGLSCGTSMASPQVAGGVGLFIEYYRDLFGVDPSPAMVKAAFLPVAHNLAGFRDANNGILGHPFDSKQGWGRMDLDAAVNPQVMVQYFDDPYLFLTTGAEWTQTISVADPSRPLRIMLVWTDAPGHGLGGSTPAWNNDLDLIVEMGGQTYRGNWFGSNGWSTPGGAADHRNNTEGVFIGPAASGSATIRVVAANLNSDAIPGNGHPIDQDFAIVCYNCALFPDFALSADNNQLEVCAPDTAVYNILVESMMGYNDPVTLSLTGEPAGTTAAFSQNPVTPTGGSLLTISDTGAAAAGGYSLVVAGAALTNTHTLNLELNLFTAVPTAPILLTPPNGAANIPTAPTFSWNALAGAASYSIQVATDAGFTNVVASASGLTNPDWTSNVTLNTSSTYYWRVWADNACGVGAYSAVWRFVTVAAPGDCSPGTEPNILYEYGFESGAAGWSSSGVGNTWSLSPLNPYAGASHYRGAGPASISDQRLVSPAVVLPADQNPVILKFWHVPNLENNGATACYDGGILEVSANGGATWTQVEDDDLLVGGYTGPISTGLSNPLGGLPGWCGPNISAYQQTIADVSAYAGETVQFRMRIGTDISISRPGWDIDNITVQSCQPEAANPGIVLTKTVGTDSSICAATDNITVVPGTAVTYCYTVENTGDVALNLHDLDDSELGSILSDFTSPLEPGASFFITQTTTIMTTTVSAATWTAYNAGPVDLVQASAATTVTVVAPAITLTVTVGLDPDVCATADRLTVAPGTFVTYCYTVRNTGDVTLTHHTMDDFDLGFGSGSNNPLAPGASFFSRATMPIMATVVNRPVWTAFVPDSTLVATASASAEVLVIWRTYFPWVGRP